MQKFLMFTLTALSCSSICATIFQADPSILKGMPALTYKESKKGFELVNKSDKTIWFTLINGDRQIYYFPQKLSSAGYEDGTKQVELDISKPTILAVYLQEPVQISYKKGSKAGFTPAPFAVYSFPTNKTIYLTWDKANFARPETGPLKGILKRTDTNLSLENNVSAADIKKEVAA